MKTFTAPEGKLVTVLVDGVEVSYVPEKEYPDDAQFIVTTPMTECPSSYNGRGVEPYRAAVMLNADGIDEENSVKGAIQGGSVTTEGMDGVVINSTSDDFSALVSIGGKYSIKNSVLNFNTKSDGKHISDFSGYGSIVTALKDSKITIEKTKINSRGVAKCAAFSDERSEVLFKDCNVAVHGGTLYEGYVNSANQKTMVAPPWVLGIGGNARGINLEGDRGTAYVVDTCFKSNQWGVLSTDAGTNMHLYVVDSDLILLGEDVPVSDCRDPYALKYGSGYGTYIIGNAYEEFQGVDIKVGCMGAVLRGGTGIYKSSKGTVKLVSPVTGETVYEAPGKGRITRIDCEFGVMAHGDGKIVYTDGTEVNANNAVFLLKAGGVTCEVSGGAKLKTGNGVILQMMDDDDNLVGAAMTESGPMFNTEFNEDAGWPSENGNISSQMKTASFDPMAGGMPGMPPMGGPGGPGGMPPMGGPGGPGGMPPMGGPGGPGGPGGMMMAPAKPDTFLNVTDAVLDGNVYNGAGYYGQKAKPLFVNLGKGAVLNGAISATETRHIDEYGKQNTHFTIKEFYHLAHVENRNFFNGDNTVEVTLTDGAVWNVTAPGIINKLTVGDGCTLNGVVTENADGTLTVSPKA